MDNNKRVYLIIGVITITMLVMGVTTAWFTWNSTDNTDVTFNVEGLDITYTGDENVLNKKLYPTMYMDNKDNIIHNFSLATTSNIDANTKISLDIINLPNELIEESFRYSLYKENNLISEGSFMDTLIVNQDNCIRFLTKAGMSDEEASTGCADLKSDIASYNSENRNMFLNFKEVNVLNESECSTYLNGLGYSTEDSTTLCNGGTKENSDLNLEIAINTGIIPSDYLVENNIISMTPSPILEISNTITLASNEKIISNTINNYTLYIWIDGEHYDNPLSMGGQSFEFKLRFDASQEGSFNKNTCFVFNESTGMITDYLCYKGNSEGMPTITDVVIPSEINGVTVTSIGREDGSLAYDYQEDNIRLIDSSSAKKYIAKPMNVSIIPGAFEKKGLTSIVLPDTITEIGNRVFLENNLTSITIPSSVASIGAEAFYNNNLTSITIPNSVTAIGGKAFSRNNLTNVIIPASVTTIGNYAFSRNNLTTIYIDKNSKLNSLGAKTFESGPSSNPNLKTIYNLGSKSLNWNNAIKGSSGTAFVSGTVTTSDGRTITITTSE